MASPTIRGTTTHLPAANTATVTLAAPTGTVSGDYQVVVLALISGGQNVPATPPTGWALLTNDECLPGAVPRGGSHRVVIYESTTATGAFTLDLTVATNRFVALRRSYQLPAGSSGRTVTLGRDLDSVDETATTHATPPVTTTVADSLVIGIGAMDYDNNTSGWTATGSWSNSQIESNGSTTQYTSLAIADTISVSPASVSTTFTANVADEAAMYAIVVNGTSDGASTEAAVVHGWGEPLPSSDDFATPGVPDPAKWSLYDGPGHDQNGIRSPAQNVVQDGYLRITGLQDGTTGGLRHVLDQQYGRWECRARMAPAAGATGDAYHAVLIVWPESNRWPEDGEYDFFEVDDVAAPTASAWLHYPHPADVPVQQEGVTHGSPVDLSAWHNYAFEWTATGLRGFLDGVEWFAFADGGGPNGRSNIQDMPSGHLTIQLDDFFGTPTLQEATLDIEWARIYTLTPVEPETRTLDQAWLGVDSIVVKTSTTGTGEQARVAFSTSPGMTSRVYSTTGLVTPDGNRVSKHTLPALTTDADYWWQVELGGALIDSPQAFHTLPAAGAQASFNFGFSSCRSHSANEPSPNPTALADAVTRGIDMFLITGDIHYRDITANTESLFEAGYDELFDRPNFVSLLRAKPTPYVWDDHDTGGDGTNGADVALPAAQAVYRDRVPSAALPHTSGIYQTFKVGRVRFVLLDVRSFRSPVGDPEGSSKTMLGAAQKTWLQGLLTAPDSPVTVIVSPVGWIGDNTDTNQDHWGFYSTERTEIGGWITGSATDTQVIFLCGDAHMLAIDDGSNAVAGTPVYHAAAMNRFTSVKGGPYSGPPAPGYRASQNAYGYVQVVDTGTQIDFTYSGYYDGGTLWASHTTTVAATADDAVARTRGFLALL